MFSQPRLHGWWAARRLMLVALLPVLAACQYLEPRSVDDIEKGKLPAGVKRTDRPAVPAVPDVQVSPAKAESERLVAQRESAATNAVLVFSVGASTAAGMLQGSELELQLTPADAGDKKFISVALACEPGACMQRELSWQSANLAVASRLGVATLAAGRWTVTGARLIEVSKQGGRSLTELSFNKPLKFNMRKGYATYLGAFTVTGGAQLAKDGNGAELMRLPLLRSSQLEQDMARALTDFPETRGRRMLNDVQGLSQAQPVN